MHTLISTKNTLILATVIPIGKIMNTIPILQYLVPFLGATLGMGIAYSVKPKTPTGFKLILAFSGAFLLGITLFHLLPEVFQMSNSKTGVWIVAGLVTQILLEYLSQGAEHGHAHAQPNATLPRLLLFSLCLHAFIEGLPLATQLPLVWGIFIHKIPIGMVLFFLLWPSKTPKIVKLLGLFLFAIMTPLGTFTLVHSPVLQEWEMPIVALVIGMLLHISTTILFESNQGHAFNIQKLLTILLAFAISYFI